MNYNIANENYIDAAPVKLATLTADRTFCVLYYNSERPSDHIKTVKYNWQKIDVLSVPAVKASLAILAQAYNPNISSDEALTCAHRFIVSYPPGIINIDDCENQIRFGYTWLELSRLHIEFLMSACNVDPIQAVERERADQFWRYMHADTKAIFNFPTIFGSPDKLRIARLVQRKQIIDLLFLKEIILPLGIEKAFGPFSEHGNQIENHHLDTSFGLMEIIGAIINQLIDKPRAEDWAFTTEFSKYTTGWLKNLWAQVLDEMILQEHRINELSGEFSIDYPFLLFADHPILEVAENTDGQIKVIDSGFASILAKKFANELEIFKPELARFFLTSVGVVNGGLQPKKAEKLAYDTIRAYGYSLSWYQAFKEDDLLSLCINYIGNWDNSINLKRYLAYEQVDKFRWALFPDACSTSVRFPNLIGEPDKVQQARLLRYKKYVDLVTRSRSLSRLLKRITKQQIYPDDLLQAYKHRLHSYIANIREQTRAEDWLSLSAMNYDRNWLRSQMKRFWETAQDELEKQQCDLTDYKRLK